MRLSVTLNESSTGPASLTAMMRDETEAATDRLLHLPGEDSEATDSGEPTEEIAPEAAEDTPAAEDFTDSEEDLTEPEDDFAEPEEEDDRSARQLLVELVLVTVEHSISRGTLPFSFEVIEPAPSPRRRSRHVWRVNLPVLRIVAAPGVHIQVMRATNPERCFYVDVIRVQDIHTLPELGMPIDVGLYMQGNLVPMRHDSDWGREFLDGTRSFLNFFEIPREDLIEIVEENPEVFITMETARVTIIPTDDGTLFYDSLCKRVLQVKVPRMSRNSGAESDNGRARYGYTVNQLPLAEYKSVTIAATDEVEVIQYCFSNSAAIEEGDLHNDEVDLDLRLQELIREATENTDSPVGRTGLSLEQIRMSPFLLFRVPQIDSVPNPGETIRPLIDLDLPRPIFSGVPRTDIASLFHLTPRRPWRSENIRYEAPANLPRMLTHIAVDVGVGMIPVVGDLVDIAEVMQAAVTGRDHWGDRVTTFELALMTLGAVLPFVGNRTVRTLGTLTMGGALATSLAPLLDVEGDEPGEADSERGLE